MDTAMPWAVTAFKVIEPHHHLVASAFYLAALFFICIFPTFDRRTEVEEHGLVPGYPSSNLEGSWVQRQLAIQQQIEDSDEIGPALDRALRESKLVAHHMNFTTAGGLHSTLTYTVANSRRGDAREANVMVIASNWTAGKRRNARVSHGLSMGVALAEFFTTQPWLSKDVIFVFVDSSLPYGAGARAWLKAYFGGTSAFRRGVLRQAVVLETSSKPSSLLLDVEGINGMLPNQDVVNAYFFSRRDKREFVASLAHRGVWESVYYTASNGGVHSSHAPFLELQVPAFTLRGRKGKKEEKAVETRIIMYSLEGLIRSLSNNLQQLHHSFNFYFYTALNRHVSNGLYLYPCPLMAIPMASFLMTAPAYRDIRSFLVGIGTIAATMAISGLPIFLLATNGEFVAWLASKAPGAVPGAPPACLHPDWSDAGHQVRRQTTASWLVAGSAAVAVLALFLRRFAFSVFDEKAVSKSGGASATTRSDSAVRLPSPLWDAVRCSSGLVFLLMIAPVAIYSWALAVPLTAISVPVLVLARPVSFRQRPLRSLFLLAFLLGHAFFLIATPVQRRELLGDAPAKAAASFYAFYDTSVVPAVPKEFRKFLPTLLVRWFRQGQVANLLDSDLLVGLYEAARDYNCVGGVLFPMFCFVYWPLLVLLALVCVVLPAQRVEDEGLSMKDLRLSLFYLLSILVFGVVGGVVWSSFSSKGWGTMQWR